MNAKKPLKPDKQSRKKHWPYIKLAKAIVTAFRLSPSDVRVYCVIASHYNSITGKTFPSLSRIAEEAGLHIQTILKSRKKLRQSGLIRWRLDKTEKNSCQYELPLLSGSFEEQQKIIENLRSGEKTTLPGIPNNSPGGRVKKSPRGQVKESPTNKKKELEEINNKDDAVSSLSLLILKKNQEQILSFQKIWTSEEWRLSPEKLDGYKRLDTYLWTGEIQKKINVDNPAGYLVSCLEKKRKIPDRERKAKELICKWLPDERTYIDEDDAYFFPRWMYLEELSQEHKKPVKDLLKEGILDDLTVKDEFQYEPLLGEFNPEQLTIMREGKFEGLVKEYRRNLAEQEAQVKQIREWRKKPEEFFEEVVEPMMEGVKYK